MVALVGRSVPYAAEDLYRRIEGLWAGQQGWPDYVQAMRSALFPSEAESSPSPLLLLPGLCCQAAGGDPDRTVDAAAAWWVLYTAAHVLDNVEDGDQTDGVPQAVNVGTGLILTALRALTESRSSGTAERLQLEVVDDYARIVLEMCGGQHADLSDTPPSLAECWRIAEAKAGAWFALACRVGARLAGTESEAIGHYDRFGYHLGLLLQINDDHLGLAPTRGKRSDLAAGKWTLPAAFALSVIPPALGEELKQCVRNAATEPAAEARARDLIEKAGALLYLSVEAQGHYRQAKLSLQAAQPLPEPGGQLLHILDTVLPSSISA